MAKKKKSFGEFVADDWFSINPKSRTKKQLADYINSTVPILHLDYFGDDRCPYCNPEDLEVPF